MYIDERPKAEVTVTSVNRACFCTQHGRHDMNVSRGQRKKQQVKSLTMGFDGLLPVVQWLVIVRLNQIEEVALGSLESGNDAPGMEEAMEAILRIFEGRPGEAERKLIEEYMRAVAMEWWREFPERRLLTKLYERTARRKAGCGSPDSRRRPVHCEGLRIAKRMLADIPDTSRLDAEWESEAVSKVLAALVLPPVGAASPEQVQRYTDLSRSSRVHYDAIKLIEKEIDNLGEAMTRKLSRWRQGSPGRPPQRPAGRNLPNERPANPSTLLRDIQVQVTIGLLQRVGIKPRGTEVAGCRIASEALLDLADRGLVPEASALSEDTVKRVWGKHFTPEMQKYSQAIAERTGLGQIPR